MEAKISKGSAVRPIHDRVEGNILLSKEDIANWHMSDAARGMTSAGETKLPPKARAIKLDPQKTYVVLRARARVRLGYGNPVGGMTLVLDASTGDQLYVRRRELVVVG